MDGEGDQYEERLREVFQSFDGSGAGSLNPEELAELCQALQLNDTALHTLLHTLIESQDQLTARVMCRATPQELEDFIYAGSALPYMTVSQLAGSRGGPISARRSS